jgi:hypothetical protein
VEVAPSGSRRGAYLLTVWRVVGGETTRPHSSTVTARELRRTVEAVVPAVIDAIEPADLAVRVEFVLPRRWLTKPVHDWTVQAEGPIAFGIRHAVVLRDLARFEGPQRDLQRRWEVLCGKREAADLLWLTCGDGGDRQRLIAWLLNEDEATTVALPGQPTPPDRHPGLNAALASKVPAVLWGGESCPSLGGCPQPCAGQRWRKAVTDELAAGPMIELPDRVLRLRRAAVAAGDEAHCGRGLALVWEDPETRPTKARLGLAI